MYYTESYHNIDRAQLQGWYYKTDIGQNTPITAFVFIIANLVFIIANSDFIIANLVFIIANSDFIIANLDFIIANFIFVIANQYLP
jgi:hypothetical protein